jgi:hypothetical protein
MTYPLDFFVDYWHVFAVVVLLIALNKYVSSKTGEQRTLLSEFPLVWALILIYTLIRGLMVDQAVLAREHAQQIMNIERNLGLLHEDWVQQQVTQHPLLVTLFNTVYVWWHWPLIVGVFVWMCRKHPDEYLVFRNGFLVSCMIGLVIFALYPVAPPRFATAGAVVDTVTDRAIFSNILLPQSLANLYAAMPSLHEGWNLLVGIALFRYAQRPIIRAFGVISPIMMFITIVATGNHYILDGIAGGAVALAGLGIATAWDRAVNQQTASETADLASIAS